MDNVIQFRPRPIKADRAFWLGPDPAFVKSILDADAAAPEATFDNINDMFRWLNDDTVPDKDAS